MENPYFMSLSGTRLKVKKNIFFIKTCSRIACVSLRLGFHFYKCAEKCRFLYSGLLYFHFLFHISKLSGVYHMVSSAEVSSSCRYAVDS